jgi:cell division protein FtsB
MGTFAKIFIVVNLVLAVVFLGAASTLLGTIEDWKGKWQDTDQLLKAEQEARKAEVKQLSEDVNSLKAQKTTLTNDNQRHLADEKERNEEWQALKEQFNQ